MRRFFWWKRTALPLQVSTRRMVVKYMPRGDTRITDTFGKIVKKQQISSGKLL